MHASGAACIIRAPSRSATLWASPSRTTSIDTPCSGVAADDENDAAHSRRARVQRLPPRRVSTRFEISALWLHAAPQVQLRKVSNGARYSWQRIGPAEEEASRFVLLDEAVTKCSGDRL